MAKDLMSYLAQNPVDQLVQEIRIPGRLEKFPIKIKPMSPKQFHDYQQIATKLGNGGKQQTSFNTGKFHGLVVINHVVEPNLRDATALSAAGVSTPEEFLNKFFLSGEILELVEQISAISGFNKSDIELEDEVKNS